MSKSSTLTSKIRIIIEIDDPGPGMRKLAEDLTGAKIAIGEINIVQNKYAASAVSTGTSVRSLLLNLRMFSFGVRTLRREFGDTNPALEAMSQALLVLAASGTMVVSGMTLMKGVVAGLTTGYSGLVVHVYALAAAEALATAGLVAVAGGAAVLVAIPLLMWINDQVSGMAALRQEAKALATDLMILEAEIESLTRTQERFNLGMSALSLQMMKLKQAIDLQESGTEAMEAAYGAMSAEMVNLRISGAGLNLMLQERNMLQKEGEALQADYDRRERAKQLARSSRLGGFMGEETIFQAMKREGITEGRPSMRSLQAAADQTRQGLMGSAPITINFRVSHDAEGRIVIEEGGGSRGADRIIYNQYVLPGDQW